MCCKTLLTESPLFQTNDHVQQEKRRAEEKLRAQRIAEATRHAASTESAKDREIRLLEAKLAPLKHRIHEVRMAATDHQ